jgi:hydroxysqualene dehydroxylase
VDARVLVLGGGLAGIAAATKLAEQDIPTLLIEQKPFLGGRLYSIQDRKTGDWIDNGQHILMGCYHETFALFSRLGTFDGLVFQKNLCIQYKSAQGVNTRLACPALPAPLHLLVGLMRMKGFTLADYWAALRFGLALKKNNPAHKGESVRAFCQRLGQTPAMQKMMWDPIAISALNEKPENACAELFVAVLRQAFFAGRKEASIVFPAVSLQALHGDGVKEYLSTRKGEVITGDKVIGLEHDGKTVKKVVLQSGRTFECRHCISALPFHRLQSLLKQSNLDKAIQVPDLGASPILSVYLWFDTPFTRDEICCLTDSDFEWILFRSNFMKPGAHARFCVCLLMSAAKGYQSLKRDELVKLALRDLQTVYPESRAMRPLSSTVFWEPRATFSPKPMIGCKRPGYITELTNFCLAGDWTDTGLPATIEGAVLSGHQCADIVRERWAGRL